MTVASADAVPKTLEERFIANLESLDRGERAHLRRNAGNTLDQARSVLGLFYRILPSGVPERQHRWYFLLATLYPLAPEANDRNFGASLRRAKTEVGEGGQVKERPNAKGMDRRFTVLLDADEDQLHFRIRQLVHLADANRVGINWQQLLKDLCDWQRPDHRVQQAWAMAYFGGAPERESAPDASPSDKSDIPGREMPRD